MTWIFHFWLMAVWKANVIPPPPSSQPQCWWAAGYVFNCSISNKPLTLHDSNWKYTIIHDSDPASDLYFPKRMTRFWIFAADPFLAGYSFFVVQITSQLLNFLISNKTKFIIPFQYTKTCFVLGCSLTLIFTDLTELTNSVVFWQLKWHNTSNWRAVDIGLNGPVVRAPNWL